MQPRKGFFGVLIKTCNLVVEKVLN